ncbi:hypothetical protein AVEN_204765-1 [Araneus ventricosus]|uniref:Uncharacterized protein n=1 Tax=Araneus ventricosus TaxID=182803 RepID=A0A4Y2FXB8_ARAVE|nr:hypothetical protein AVEN_204765-1 [Araneus ventricosus]
MPEKHLLIKTQTDPPSSSESIEGDRLFISITSVQFPVNNGTFFTSSFVIKTDYRCLSKKTNELVLRMHERAFRDAYARIEPTTSTRHHQCTNFMACTEA